MRRASRAGRKVERGSAVLSGTEVPPLPPDRDAATRANTEQILYARQLQLGPHPHRHRPTATQEDRELSRVESRERKIDANHKTRKNKNVTATEHSSPTPRPPLSRPHHYLINPLLRQSFSSDSVHLLRAGTAAAVSKVRPAASWSFFSSAASTFSVHMTGGSSGFTLECPATPGLVPRSWSMTGSTPR